MSRNSMAQYYGISGGPGGAGTVNNPQPTWTRYGDYFLKQAGYDTTGIAMSVDIVNLGGFTCTLISNRHVLLANHVSYGALPLDVYFVNNSNVTFKYQIISAQQVFSSDIRIGYLNQPVDSTLKFLKVVPENFLNNFHSSASSSTGKYPDTLPVLYNTNGYYAGSGGVFGSTDTWRRTWCGTLRYKDLDSEAPGSLLRYIYPVAGKKYNNSETLVNGDSGNIVFIPINNEIVILGAWYGGADSTTGKAPGESLGSTPFMAPYINQINSAMTTLAGASYSLTQASLPIFNAQEVTWSAVALPVPAVTYNALKTLNRVPPINNNVNIEDGLFPVLPSDPTVNSVLKIKPEFNGISINLLNSITNEAISPQKSYL